MGSAVSSTLWNYDKLNELFSYIKPMDKTNYLYIETIENISLTDNLDDITEDKLKDYQLIRIFNNSLEIQIKPLDNSKYIVVITTDDLDIINKFGLEYIKISYINYKSYFLKEKYDNSPQRFTLKNNNPNMKLKVSYYSSEQNGQFIRWTEVV